MGLFNKRETTKVNIEIFKGNLEKAAISDYSKKEFSENTELKETVFIVEGADEKVIDSARKRLTFKVNASEEFKVSYLVLISNDNRICKLIVIISEGLEEDFSQFMAKNKFILRIQK